MNDEKLDRPDRSETVCLIDNRHQNNDSLGNEDFDAFGRMWKFRIGEVVLIIERDTG
jgi:hypothetical protein